MFKFKILISLLVIIAIISTLILNGLQIVAAFFAAVLVFTVIFAIGVEIALRIMKRNGVVTHFMRAYQGAYTLVAFIIMFVVFMGFLMPVYYLLKN